MPSLFGRHQATELGAFPFPLSEDGSESRQLVWIRTRSNYLGSRGPSDYLRAVAVLVRGVIGNAIILLPILLLLASLVAAIHISDWGFGLTLTLCLLIVGWIAIAPLVTRLGTIVHVKKVVEMGTSGSVTSRGRYEAGFGLLLLLAMLFLLLEGLSALLDDFHLLRQRSLGVGELASGATVAIGVLASMSKVLPAATGVARRLALVVVGVVGTVLPLVVVMFVADYLVFGSPGAAETDTVLGFAGLLMMALMVGLVSGIFTRAFTLKFILKSLGALALTFLLLVIGIEALDESEAAEQQLELDMASFDWLNEAPTTEFNGLIAAMVDRPPTVVTELTSKLDRSFEDAVYFESICAPASDAISQATCTLEKSATYLPGLLDLASEVQKLPDQDFVEDSAAPYVADELLELAWAAEALAPLFGNAIGFDEDAGAVSEANDSDDFALLAPDESDELRFMATPELLEYILDGLPLDQLESIEPSYPGPRVDTGNVDGWITDYAEQAFPELSQLAPDELAVALGGLNDLNNLVYQVRVESARSLTLPRVAEQVEFGDSLSEFRQRIRNSQLVSSLTFGLLLAGTIWAYGWLALDPNKTSLHGMYRDRLARAFLIGADTKGDIDIEEDLDLDELSCYAARSTAPYHLINAAINLQGSKDPTIGDRKSDFFVFSKRFVGSERTGYCRSETMEQAFPQMSIASAMAISAAAAAPNMGRMTSPMLTSIMALLNVRLGIWLPNPGKLEEKMGAKPGPTNGSDNGFSLDEVLDKERNEVEQRWEQCGVDRQIESGLVGLALSGGGVRSATLNLGIVQALHAAGVFGQVDYMSTVSGGGYIGSSISVAMRGKEPTRTRSPGQVTIDLRDSSKEVVISPDPRRKQQASESRLPPADRYVYASTAELAVSSPHRVSKNDRLLQLGDPDVIAERAKETPDEQEKQAKASRRHAYSNQYRWRVRTSSLFTEMLGRPHERKNWVNVSDGGHVENLAVFELLRRRCKYIIVGDAEMDPKHEFNGLAILMRTARVELGVDIDLDVEPLRVNKKGRCKQHWAIGSVHYPEKQRADGSVASEAFTGYLLYLKSSLVGDEGEDIRGYAAKNPAFPHQSTADQFFDEGQFESHRSLGQLIASAALRSDPDMKSRLSNLTANASFEDIESWFKTLRKTTERNAAESN